MLITLTYALLQRKTNIYEAKYIHAAHNDALYHVAYNLRIFLIISHKNDGMGHNNALKRIPPHIVYICKFHIISLKKYRLDY